MRSPLRLLAIAVLAVGATVSVLALGVASVLPRDLLGGLGAIGPVIVPDGSPSTDAVSSIAPGTLSLYQLAATSCPGLSWSVLAAIGTIESSNGTSQLPGVHSGANYAGAEGPMQFEPSTFAEYDQPVPPGGADPPNPYDQVDAVYAAARLLCANGAAHGVDLEAAIFSYNHSQSYVDQVLALARRYASDGG